MYVPRYSISLVKERTERYDLSAMSSAKDAVGLFSRMFLDADREKFVVITLDAKNKPIGVNVVSVGTLTMSLVHPREVFKMAILQNAAGILCAHNHPSGDCTPSREDRDLTSKLKNAGELLGIKLLDHIVLGENDRYYSFADGGTL